MIGNRETVATTARHTHALDAIEAGLDAAHPRTVIEASVGCDGSRLEIDGTHYRLAEYDDVVVLGGGNAAGHVAAALEKKLGDRIDRGIVVTDDPCETTTVEVVEGTHPLPSQANVDGTRRLLGLAAETTEDDLVLVVITGGGSALMCAPVEDVPLPDYRETTDALLRSGATIDGINAVRKHLSTIKGGRLARLIAPADVTSVIVSDVVGNRLDVIASGPTTPDPSTYDDALDIRERFGIEFPRSVDSLLQTGAEGDRRETPTADDPAFEDVHNVIVARSRTALDAAAGALEVEGYRTVVLSSRIEGEASEVGTVQAGIARECLATGDPFDPPVAVLSGGETTVTVDGEGRGGPNQEFALATSLALEGTDALVAAVDSDGIDGNTDLAGAILGPDTIGQTARRARSALASNDVTPYLEDRDALISTGPSGTNVNDFRLLLVGTPSN